MNNSGFTEKRYHHRLDRGRIILQKGNVYLNKEDGEQYELVGYMDEPSQLLVRNLNTRTTKVVSIHQLENFKMNERTDLSVDLTAISNEYWERLNKNMKRLNRY